MLAGCGYAVLERPQPAASSEEAPIDAAALAALADEIRVTPAHAGGVVMTYRLERAAQMLRLGEGNVGEVAYAVGFRSVSHFTRRFREQHGVTPSAWRRGEGAPALRVIDGGKRGA